MKVSTKLHYLRDNLELSRWEFALKFHIRYKNLVKWENDEAIPKEKDIKRLAKYFDFVPLYFLSENTSIVKKKTLTPNDFVLSKEVYEKEEQELKEAENCEQECLEDFPRESNERYEDKD